VEPASINRPGRTGGRHAATIRGITNTDRYVFFLQMTVTNDAENRPAQPATMVCWRERGVVRLLAIPLVVAAGKKHTRPIGGRSAARHAKGV